MRLHLRVDVAPASCSRVDLHRGRAKAVSKSPTAVGLLVGSSPGFSAWSSFLQSNSPASGS
jgi:hypothetical protein